MLSKKHLRAAIALAAAGSLFLAACSSKGGDDPTTPPPADSPSAEQTSEEPPAPEPEPPAAGAVAPGDLIAVSMPWEGTQNFAEAVALFPAAIEAAGFQAVVQSADNKVTNQQSQIDSFVEQGAKVIVVGAVDGKQLGSVLDNAKAAGITIIGYDRLLEETTSVDGVVQYGAFRTGVLQAEALLQGLKEKVSDAGPWTIELFAGGPADPNAKFFFDGAMSVLQPLIDDKTITVGSGQVDFATVATADWDNGKAQTRMDSVLAGNYTDKGPDGVLAPNDGIARAILTSVENAGLALPVVDGLDAEDESVQWVRDGKQYATVAKPTQPLIDETLRLVQALTTGTELPAPTGTTNNGVKEVNLYELDPTIVTQANVNDFFPAS